MTAFRIFCTLGVPALLALAPGPAPGQAPGRVVRVPCLTDGVLLLVGAEVNPQQKVIADRVRMTFSPTPRPYQLLREGDAVTRGQVLAQLDDGLARVALEGARLNHAFAEALEIEAMEFLVEAAQRLNRISALKGRDRGLIPEDEYAAALALARQCRVDLLAAKEVSAAARAEYDRAVAALDLHTVRSPADGVVWRIRRQAGELVRPMEPLFEIEILDKKS